MNNYLITGHKGFIGTNLLNYLKTKGNVKGLDLPEANACCFYIPDKSIDIVIHLAASTDVRESIKSPVEVISNNIDSTISMLEFARASESKFIFISSCGAANPTNPYTASKLACESICQSYRESYNMDISILRLANVYGPYSMHKTSVITKFIKAKLDNKQAMIYGSGNQLRDFIHVQDVCKAIYECNSNFMEVSTGKLTSINSIATFIGCEVNHIDPIQGEVMSPSISKWSGCEVNLIAGLNLTMLWYEDNYKQIIN